MIVAMVDVFNVVHMTLFLPRSNPRARITKHPVKYKNRERERIIRSITLRAQASCLPAVAKDRIRRHASEKPTLPGGTHGNTRKSYSNPASCRRRLASHVL